MTVTTLVIVLTLFQIKHFLGDYQWQTHWMIDGKSRYGAPGGVIHAAVHSTLSLPILLIAGATPEHALLLATAEFVVHYHIDWAKLRFSPDRARNPDEKAFWQAFGIDQAAHQITYVLMIFSVLCRTSITQ